MEYKPETSLLNVLGIFLWVAAIITIIAIEQLMQCYVSVHVLDVLCVCQVSFSQ